MGKTSYAVEQNRDSAEWAYDLVGAARSDAVLDTMGVLRDGKEFFASIDLGVLVLDPDGIGDAIKRHLCVRNSHDGSLSLMAMPTNIRVVCRNTATWATSQAKAANQVHVVKHTSGKDDRKAEAVEAMGLARKLGDLFTEQALQMIQTPGGRQLVTQTVSALWKPPTPDSSDRQRTSWNDRLDTIQAIYASPTCAQGFGDSAWTAWNAITQYVDHSRKRSTEQSRAMDAINVASVGSKVKTQAADFLLSV